MNIQEPINYCEFAAKDLQATKQFFSACFNWSFTDFGEDYTEFTNAGPIKGGFHRANLQSKSAKGGALIVLYSKQLEQTLAKVQQHGGQIAQPIFEFPGGRRFHFLEPSGNEFAVWSDL